MDDEERLSALERRLGYIFVKRARLGEALTHATLTSDLAGRGETRAHNQRLAFLGDAVLGLVTASAGMAGSPAASKGELNNQRAEQVNNQRLAQMGAAIHVGECMSLGGAVDDVSGRKNPKLLAEAFEAVIGAVFEDCGFEHTRRVVDALYTRHPLLTIEPVIQ